MLFQIDDDVSKLFLSGSPEPRDTEALKLLALSAVEGNHKVVGRRKTLTQLARVLPSGSRESKALERAAGLASQEGGLPHKLLTFGRVIAAPRAAPSSAASGNQRIITFPLRWFDSTEKIQPVTLLGENLVDTEVFMRMGEAGSVLASISHLLLKAVRISGGGSTTATVLAHLATSNHVCLCIVDSDKASPTGAIGSTAQSVAPYKNPVHYPLIGVEETRGRDLENSLPDSFYMMAYPRATRWGSLSNVLQQLTKAGEHETRAHLDIEKGLCVHDIAKHPPISPERTFWQSKIAVVVSFAGANLQNLPCMAAFVCPQQKRHNCTCVAVGGNSNDVLRNFVDSNKHVNRYALVKALDNSVIEEWRRLGVMIASWCCGDDSLRI